MSAISTEAITMLDQARRQVAETSSSMRVEAARELSQIVLRARHKKLAA